MSDDTRRVEAALAALLDETDERDGPGFWGAVYDHGLAWVGFPDGFGGLVVTTGGTGFSLSNGRRPKLITTKIRRTAISGANGLLVLVPSALFLASKAASGEFTTAFYTVQAIELIAGAVNITLLGLNMRDGFKMTGRFRRQAVKPIS